LSGKADCYYGPPRLSTLYQARKEGTNAYLLTGPLPKLYTPFVNLSLAILHQ